MKQNIKEKVFEAIYEELEGDYDSDLDFIVGTGIDLTLTEIGKVIKRCKVRSIVPLPEKGMLEFDTGEGFISVEELKQKLGIK